MATAISYQLQENCSGGIYFNLTRSHGKTSYTIFPNFNMTITKNISVLVEAGINQIDQSASSVLAGGGLTWMTTPSLQLDISMDIGLNRKSPDFLGGFGFSVFFN